MKPFDQNGDKIGKGHEPLWEGLGPFGLFLLGAALFVLLGGGLGGWIFFFREADYRACWLPALGAVAAAAAVSFTLTRSRASLPSVLLVPVLAWGAVFALFLSQTSSQPFLAGLILGGCLSMLPAGALAMLLRPFRPQAGQEPPPDDSPDGQEP